MCSQNVIMIVTCSGAAIGQAATPAAKNPAPAKTAGAARTAATPVFTAATVFPSTRDSRFFFHLKKLLINKRRTFVNAT